MLSREDENRQGQVKNKFPRRQRCGVGSPAMTAGKPSSTEDEKGRHRCEADTDEHLGIEEQEAEACHLYF